MNQARPQNKPPCGLVGSGSTSEPSPGSSVGLLVVSSSRSSIPRTTSSLRRGHGPGMGRENKTHPRPVRRGERTLRAACSARVRAYDLVTKCSSQPKAIRPRGTGRAAARTRQGPGPQPPGARRFPPLRRAREKAMTLRLNAQCGERARTAVVAQAASPAHVSGGHANVYAAGFGEGPRRRRAAGGRADDEQARSNVDATVI